MVVYLLKNMQDYFYLAFIRILFNSPFLYTVHIEVRASEGNSGGSVRAKDKYRAWSSCCLVCYVHCKLRL